MSGFLELIKSKNYGLVIYNNINDFTLNEGYVGLVYYVKGEVPQAKIWSGEGFFIDISINKNDLRFVKDVTLLPNTIENNEELYVTEDTNFIYQNIKGKFSFLRIAVSKQSSVLIGRRVKYNKLATPIVAISPNSYYWIGFDYSFYLYTKENHSDKIRVADTYIISSFIDSTGQSWEYIIDNYDPSKEQETHIDNIDEYLRIYEEKATQIPTQKPNGNLLNNKVTDEYLEYISNKIDEIIASKMKESVPKKEEVKEPKIVAEPIKEPIKEKEETTNIVKKEVTEKK